MRHRFAILAALAAVGLAPSASAQAPPVLHAQIHSPAPFSNLGPLAGRISPGQSGAWTVQDQNGRLVLANPAGQGAIRFYVTDWQGDLAATGRSVSVSVAADGKGSLSAAGILFRVQDADPRWLAFVETAQGKLALYTRHPNELKQTGSTDIPGGHLPEGDLLTLNQQGDTAQLLVNGHLVTELKSDGGNSPNIPAPVGIIAMDTGTFDFASFAFGRLVAPLAAPIAGNDNIPMPPTGDDSIPTNQPPTPPAPATVGNLPSLGALGRNVKLGDVSGWITTIENGQLVYTHPSANSLGYFYRSLAWPGPAAQGRSATITVDANGDGPNAAGGIGFGISDDGNKLYVWAIAADGKATLYQIANDNLETLAAFDPPNPRPGGGRHVLKVSQTTDAITLFADGKLLGTMTGKAAQNAEGAVGLAVLGKGRFAFQDFSFGPATPAEPAPQPPPDPAPRRTGKPLQSFTADTFGALFGIMAHEFGHFMIGELKIPATGPEEDVADEFAAMVFIDNLSDAPELTRAMALGNAKLWWFMAQDHGDNSTPFYDEHAPDRARFAKFSCMLYGAAPQVFNGLMDAAGIPDRTKQRCIADEPKRHAAWDKLLTPMRRRGVAPNIPGDLDPATPGHTVTVVYEEPKDPAMRPFAEELRDSGAFEVIAEAVAKQFVLPRDTKIVFRDCGVENCFYSPSDGSVTMCWEMINFVMQEFRKHGQNAPLPPQPGPVPGPAPAPGPGPNPGPSLSLDQFLIGRWHERSNANGMVIDMQLEFGPQNMYQAQLQVMSPQPMTIQVQGQWRITPTGDNRAQINFVPIRWFPPQAPMNPTTVPIELVDRNTFRSADGIATRLP